MELIPAAGHRIVLRQFHLLVLKFRFGEGIPFTKSLFGFSLSLPRRDRPFGGGGATPPAHDSWRRPLTQRRDCAGKPGTAWALSSGLSSAGCPPPGHRRLVTNRRSVFSPLFSFASEFCPAPTRRVPLFPRLPTRLPQPLPERPSSFQGPSV